MGEEPAGDLDCKSTEIVFDIFKQLAQDFGQTIIAVTHDNDFAKASDRTIEMADGRIINHDKIFKQPIIILIDNDNALDKYRCQIKFEYIKI